MSPQESRLLRNAAQIAINVRTIHDHAMRAGLPWPALADSAASKIAGRRMLNEIVSRYLHYIAHYDPLRNASDNARPR
jgi:hypothetical protein